MSSVMLRVFKKDGRVVYQVVRNGKIVSQSTKFDGLNLKPFKYKLR